MLTEKFQIFDENNTVVEEAFSFLKANFHFSEVEKHYRSLALISSNPKEGRTTIAINISKSFANAGVKTLLVDTDFRKAAVTKKLSGDFKNGLSDCITQNLKLEDVIITSNIDNLHYLHCGSKVVRPADMFSSKGFEEFLKEVSLKYELIIFDTPALSSVVDGYIIAGKADATALIVKSGEVSLPKLKRIKRRLEEANVNVIGVVLNKVDKREYRKNFEAYDYFQKRFKFTKRIK